MTLYPNRVKLIQSLSDLPNLAGAVTVYLDFETTSGDTKLDSLNPWHHCKTAGICITVDSDPRAYYIPVGHNRETPAERNLDKMPVRRWLFDILEKSAVLVAQSAKYELHILKNDWNIDYNGVTYCTLTQAKLIDSDRMSYKLEDLSKDWLGEDIDHYKNALRPYLYDQNGNSYNRDYGEIPISIIAPYGGQDVLTARKLKQFIESKLPAQSALVSEHEIKMTDILFGIEQTGMCVDPIKVRLKKLETLSRLLCIMQRIKDLTGIDMRPNTSDDCYNFLCGQYGLPILEWTNDDDDSKVSNPSFSKNAMSAYLVHPRVREDPVLLESVELIQEFRTLHTFNSLFLNTYETRNINGILHPTYNQAVRTARLSCSDPNTQQLSLLAKGLIEVPTDGGDDPWLFVDIDLSQIEFRLIASTINNRAVIEQYKSDPTTDYHQLVADLAGLDRKPAKNLNFAVGFGAGKKKSIQMVKGSLDISSQGYKDSGMDFDTYCQMRATEMYSSYHRMLPELKPTMRKSTNIAAKYGYLANLYGRRRHLPGRAVYKAFNAYIQSSAADIAKHISVMIAEYISSLEGSTIKLIGVVHDSWCFYMRRSALLTHVAEIEKIICSVKTPNEMRVPVLCSVDVSSTNWAEAKPLERS